MNPWENDLLPTWTKTAWMGFFVLFFENLPREKDNIVMDNINED